MLNTKKPIDLTLSDLDHLIQRKLLLYLKDKKLNHKDYVNCSRGFSAIMGYIETKEGNVYQ